MNEQVHKWKLINEPKPWNIIYKNSVNYEKEKKIPGLCYRIYI